MELDDMKKSLNHRVRLRFADGEVVDAILLGITPGEDITYEVQTIISLGTPPARGTAPGATCISGVIEVSDWSETQ